jgi:hypothetical protein
LSPALAALPRADAISTPPETPLLDALRLTPRGFSTVMIVSPAAARVATTRRAGPAAATALDLTRAPAKEEPRTAVRGVATVERAAIAIGDVSASDGSAPTVGAPDALAYRPSC